MEQLQALVVLVEGAKPGAILKVVNPDGTEATVNNTCYMTVERRDAEMDRGMFAEMMGKPTFVVLHNVIRQKFGIPV